MVDKRLRTVHHNNMHTRVLYNQPFIAHVAVKTMTQYHVVHGLPPTCLGIHVKLWNSSLVGSLIEVGIYHETSWPNP
jgi:hypothetical protein